jgi:hypothetical protein
VVPWQWDFEERADHYRQIPCPLSIAWAQLGGGELDRSHGALAKDAFRIITEDQPCQLLTAIFRKDENQPCCKIIGDKRPSACRLHELGR